MGTRSTIALEFADGTVHQVYCHWDGYLEHNGKILAEHYSDPFKLRDLIDLGGLSSLGANIGAQHEFGCLHKYGSPEYLAWSQAKEDMCTFYARDRGEDLRVNKFKDYADYVANHQYEEYDYILRNDNGVAVWFVSDNDGAYVTLAEAFEAEKETA